MKTTISLLVIAFSFCAFGQEKCDTLFIKYDDKLLQKRKHPLEDYFYYIIKDYDNKEDITFFIVEDTIKKNTLKKHKSTRLKKILKNSKAYYKKDKFDDWELFDYFNKIKQNTIIFVDGNKYYKVGVVYAIE